MSEILADGSEIRSLSGRSAKLGDGFSRNPAGRDELLEARTKDIAGVAGQLKKFNLDEYLGEGTETTSSVPWAIGDDAVPDPLVLNNRRTYECYKICSSEVRVLVAMDYQKLKDGNAVLKDASRLLEQALPGISVGMRACYGPFEDDEGCCSHFDGAVARLPAGNKKNKRMSVDLLTSCAKVLREVAAYKPDLILGFGQGGVVVALLRWPLVVELTLQARNLQTKEVREIGSSWGRIKAVWSVNPRVWRTQLRATEVKEAIPELLKDFVVDPLIMVLEWLRKRAVLTNWMRCLRLFVWRRLLQSQRSASGECSPNQVGKFGSTMVCVLVARRLIFSVAVQLASRRKLKMRLSRCRKELTLLRVGT